MGCDSEALLQAVRFWDMGVLWDVGECDSEALLQAVRCLGCGWEWDSEALLQAVRFLGCWECDSEARPRNRFWGVGVR